jgi:hypothetical protein
MTTPSNAKRMKSLEIGSSGSADGFFCHPSGKRIEAGVAIEHRSRITIGLRDEVDPDWWHRAMREMKKEEEIRFTPPSHWLEDEEEDVSDTNPEFAQSGCLSPSRLDQHGEKAQIICDKDAPSNPDTVQGMVRGMSASCTADEELRSELEMLRRTWIKASKDSSGTSRQLNRYPLHSCPRRGCTRSPAGRFICSK